ncbi:MAG: sel1 repeat family protein [Cyanobacteria bacterium SZAS LIN-3]|nr:sel1 repeat family protein [Cyanobacteria bacterium SZAS LIN-3]MBS2008137.1 sel1 repeat family protein [Cyanobacteria bacterium SZAS TMP-1]
MSDTGLSQSKSAAFMAQGFKSLKDRHYTEAARHFEQAAILGLVDAQYELGMLYEKGMGVRTDSAKARSLYEKAAKQNHIQAIEKMAEFVSEGIGGHKNLDEARQWSEKAQSLRDARAKTP